MDDIQSDLTELIFIKRGLNRNDEKKLKQTICKIVQDVSDAKELSSNLFTKKKEKKSNESIPLHAIILVW